MTDAPLSAISNAPNIQKKISELFHGNSVEHQLQQLLN
jgi:hypothetical protein